MIFVTETHIILSNMISATNHDDITFLDQFISSVFLSLDLCGYAADDSLQCIELELFGTQVGL